MTETTGQRPERERMTDTRRGLRSLATMFDLMEAARQSEIAGTRAADAVNPVEAWMDAMAPAERVAVGETIDLLCSLLPALRTSLVLEDRLRVESLADGPFTDHGPFDPATQAELERFLSNEEATECGLTMADVDPAFGSARVLDGRYRVVWTRAGQRVVFGRPLADAVMLTVTRLRDPHWGPAPPDGPPLVAGPEEDLASDDGGPPAGVEGLAVAVGPDGPAILGPASLARQWMRGKH